MIHRFAVPSPSCRRRCDALEKVRGTPKHMPNDGICSKGAPLLT